MCLSTVTEYLHFITCHSLGRSESIQKKEKEMHLVHPERRPAAVAASFFSHLDSKYPGKCTTADFSSCGKEEKAESILHS